MSECAELYAAIARLEAKIDAQGKTDINQIISQVKAALSGDKTFMGLVGASVLGGGGLSQFLSKQNKNESRINDLRSKLENNFKKAESLEKEFNRVKSQTSGAISKLEKFRDSTSKTLNKLGPITNAFAVIGGAAGLLSLYHSTQVAPKVQESQQRQLDRFGKELDLQSKFNSRINQSVKQTEANIKKVFNAAEDAKDDAYSAQKEAERAYKKANDGAYEARVANNRAIQANKLIASASKKANDAAYEARVGNNRAIQAGQKANDAAYEARVGNNRAIQAGQKANDAAYEARVANNRAIQAQNSAANANSVASQAQRSASNANAIAQQALTEARKPSTTTIDQTARVRADAAQRSANEALAEAKKPHTTIDQAARAQASSATAAASTAAGTASAAAGAAAIAQATANQALTEARKPVAAASVSPTQLQTAIKNSPEIQQVQSRITQQEKMNQEGNNKLDELNKNILPIATGIAILTPLVQGIQRQTTPQALQTAAAAGTCQTTQPGGCTSNLVNNAANNSTANIQNTLNGINTAALIPIYENTNTIISRVGPQVPGGISGFLGRFAKSIHLDKVINALTLITALHNAAMLSRSLASTLGDLTGQALSVIGLKDEDGAAIDVNKILSQQIDQLFISILGEAAWKGLKTTWNKANAIISSATQIIWTVRSLFDSGREILEWTAENTGKIGNALKRFRVVGENAYRWMPERVTATNVWTEKVNRAREGIDSLDDAASSLSSVLGEVQNIQQEAKELQEQKERFDKNLKEFTPKTREDNKPIADAVAAAKIASKAPADAADVFRGEGESANA